jgi:CO dehydrogenase maturation factor
VRDAVDATPKDWAKFTRQAVDFHVKNALTWAYRVVGDDLRAGPTPSSSSPQPVTRHRP